MAGYEHLTVERSGATVTITMRRPAKRNALSTPHLEELLRAFTETAQTDATGVILAGEGPVFSAGHDFAEVASLDTDGVRQLLDPVRDLSA